ncbi:xanthine dehydrogenase family protein molybdopterin-binding subunit [Chryseosolibacter indicus]|uniref:Xanthine dehydrogenase family protein molybdopterin-binding subunit n=1 Tax=Chryseosolibacter indicus TaxID=2782351 RepID=A0ABS5VN58_9BACT|nr:xanthine dehydrogenase family protein molybdopterin-binding subunit [Chryseosolibacter indicus]MBT1702887.1 xanthine dehydrogenase family protein molybdopterin-binding subunit [Chryseosolibacter indicus]
MNASNTTNTDTSYIGRPVNRVDGVLKVTGKAQYAGEYNTSGLLHGIVICSPIPRGKITSVSTSDALKVKGVKKVFTHENVKGLPWFDLSYKDMELLPGSPFRPFYSNEILFSQQPVALVVAESLELARYASTLVRIQYETAEFETSLERNLKKGFTPRRGKTGYEKPKSRGKAERALKKADVKVEAAYFHGAEHHNPMEMFSSTVLYENDDKLTIYDKTQGVLNSQSYVTRVFGLKSKNVRVLSPFVGGAFGSGLRPQYQLFMSVLAALDLKQSVRVTLTRQQMFSFGHRPITWQKLELGANKEGRLMGISHTAISETSRFETYTENVVNWSGRLYECENVRLDYQLVPLDVNSPLDMRAPGAATGVLALECAMDELAYALNIDPLELRLKNYTEIDPAMKRAFSSKNLMDCYKQGAEHFGWEKRSYQPRSMKDGKHLIGWGMSSGMWDAMMMPARAKARLTPDGKLTVSSATADIGTGTYTIMTQIAAETLGLPLNDVTFMLGDSSFVFAPFEGGSSTAASVGTAVLYVCQNIKEEVFKLAQKIDGSPFHNTSIEKVVFANGYITSEDDPQQTIAIAEVLQRSGVKFIEEKSTDLKLKNLIKQGKYSRNTHSAVFVEVKVDEDLGMISVTRVVSAVAAGTIINPKTSRSQVLGGVIWGISMALHEDTFLDNNLGRFMNHDLAEYHIPVHADNPEIEVIFVREKDEIINPLGVKGLGEIGIIGVASAVANAVFHATGKRVREFPITLDKVF